MTQVVSHKKRFIYLAQSVKSASLHLYIHSKGHDHLILNRNLVTDFDSTIDIKHNIFFF